MLSASTPIDAGIFFRHSLPMRELLHMIVKFQNVQGNAASIV